MAVAGPDDLLRPGLLEGVLLLLAGPPARASEAGFAPPVAQVCAALGASVATVAAGVEESALDAAVADALGDTGALDLLAIDGAGLFAERLARAGSGHAALRACLDGAWNATRAVVNHAFLKAPEPRGRIVYIAPPPGAGEHAEAARAGLENLARTLSIEWARHRITPVTIAPGTDSSRGEVAALVAYLASPAGAYFSGCLLDLRGARLA